jgi:hypothetical protein
MHINYNITKSTNMNLVEGKNLLQQIFTFELKPQHAFMDLSTQSNWQHKIKMDVSLLLCHCKRILDEI